MFASTFLQMAVFLFYTEDLPCECHIIVFNKKKRRKYRIMLHQNLCGLERKQSSFNMSFIRMNINGNV